MEADHVILVTVRSNPRCNIGFLNEMGRVNTSISRARYSLTIIGDVHCLQGSGGIWSDVITEIRDTEDGEITVVPESSQAPEAVMSNCVEDAARIACNLQQLAQGEIQQVPMISGSRSLAFPVAAENMPLGSTARDIFSMEEDAIQWYHR